MSDDQRVRTGFLVTSGNFMFRYRDALFPLFFISLFCLSRPADWMALGPPWLIIPVFGIGMALAGQGFRLFVIGFAYIRRGGRNRKVFAKDLVTQGMYAHTRNPIYIGNVLFVLGICIQYGSLLGFAVILPLFLFTYLAITMAEEAYLRGKFGEEYEEYARTVRRFLPRLKGLKATMDGFHYDWKKALRKDFGNIFTTLFLITFIGCWETYPHLGKPVLFASGILFLLNLTLWLALLILKKKGSLDSPKDNRRHDAED